MTNFLHRSMSDGSVLNLVASWIVSVKDFRHSMGQLLRRLITSSFVIPLSGLFAKERIS